MVTYMNAMATTIQISEKLRDELKKRKAYDNESYEDLIWDLLEDTMELSEQTKQDIKKSMEDIKAGRVISFEEVKKKYGLR